MTKKPAPAAVELQQTRMIIKLKAGCRRAAGNPMTFFYAKEGPHQLPFLAIGKSAEVKAEAGLAGLNVKSQEKAKIVSGTVSRGDDGRLVFKTDNPGGARFSQNLKRAPLSRVSALKNAHIRSDGGEETASTESTSEEAGSTSEWTRQRAKKVWSRFADRLERAGRLEEEIQSMLDSGSQTLEELQAADARITRAIKKLDKAVVRAQRLLKEVQQ